MPDRILPPATILARVMDAFAPVANWYIPEGDESYADEYPKAIASAVEDLVTDRNLLNDLRRAASKVVEMHDKGGLAELVNDSSAIEELRDLLRPDDS